MLVISVKLFTATNHAGHSVKLFTAINHAGNFCKVIHRYLSCWSFLWSYSQLLIMLVISVKLFTATNHAGHFCEVIHNY